MKDQLCTSRHFTKVDWKMYRILDPPDNSVVGISKYFPSIIAEKSEVYKEKEPQGSKVRKT